jgi:hypothetical protein
LGRANCRRLAGRCAASFRLRRHAVHRRARAAVRDRAASRMSGARRAHRLAWRQRLSGRDLRGWRLGVARSRRRTLRRDRRLSDAAALGGLQ